MQSGAEGRPGEDAPPGGCRILVAEDNRDAAESLGELLQMLGYEVALAYDGAQAVETARTFVPEVALLDIGMPKLDGYQAGRQIRDQAAGRPLKMVALTGWDEADHRRRAKEAGFDAHLVKPVDLDALTALLPAPTSGGQTR